MFRLRSVTLMLAPFLNCSPQPRTRDWTPFSSATFNVGFILTGSVTVENCSLCTFASLKFVFPKFWFSVSKVPVKTNVGSRKICRFVGFPGKLLKLFNLAFVHLILGRKLTTFFLKWFTKNKIEFVIEFPKYNVIIYNHFNT